MDGERCPQGRLSGATLRVWAAAVSAAGGGNAVSKAFASLEHEFVRAGDGLQARDAPDADSRQNSLRLLLAQVSGRLPDGARRARQYHYQSIRMVCTWAPCSLLPQPMLQVSATSSVIRILSPEVRAHTPGHVPVQPAYYRAHAVMKGHVCACVCLLIRCTSSGVALRAKFCPWRGAKLLKGTHRALVDLFSSLKSRGSPSTTRACACLPSFTLPPYPALDLWLLPCMSRFGDVYYLRSLKDFKSA